MPLHKQCCLPVLVILGLISFCPVSAYSKDRERPAQLESSEIAGFDLLSEGRRKVLTTALETGRNHGWLKYMFGSNDPARGGLDCSGAVYYVLRSAGLNPPRSSAEQYEWVEGAGKLVKIGPEIRTLDDPAFKSLKPGDLLFWSGTYHSSDGRKVDVSHVQIYLGREKAGDQPVMIGSSDGRSYHGRAQNGYGVFDFSLPRENQKGRFVGFGPPPGMDSQN